MKSIIILDDDEICPTARFFVTHQNLEDSYRTIAEHLQTNYPQFSFMNEFVLKEACEYGGSFIAYEDAQVINLVST